MSDERDEYLAQRREIRADMHRGCDTSIVRRCAVCGGTTTALHYGQPATCDCDTFDPDDARRAGDDEDDDR